MTYRILIILTALFVLGGCSLTQKSDSPVAVIDRSTSERDSPSFVMSAVIQQDTSSSSSAVGRLIQLAQTHQKKQEWSQAANALERALRISPRDAQLWLQLSEIRFNQQQYKQSESLAMKALQYANTRTLKRECWLQVAQSRERLGNRSGAQQARQSASQYD